MPTTILLPASLRFLRRFEFPHKLGILERIYGRRLATHGQCWVETAHGPAWKLDLRSCSQRWLIYGFYEGPTFLPWAMEWLRAGGCVIDSGANIGQTTLYFASVPGVRVLALEPNPEAREWLEECLATQCWNVDVVPNGLGARAGRSLLKLPLFEGEADAQATLHRDWYTSIETRDVEIDITTLDDAMRERGIDRVRLWKLDVEGWEHEALAGAEGALRRAAIDAIYLELTEPNVAFCTDLLCGCGYEFHRIAAGGKLVAGLGEVRGVANVLALSPRARG